jgi:hypothetical protein
MEVAKIFSFGARDVFVKHLTNGLVEKSLKLIVEVCGTEKIESGIKDIFINATFLQDMKNI